MAELKKCPFCGSEKLKMDSKNGKIHYHEKDGMREWQHVVFSIRCNKCNARGGAVGADLPTMGMWGDLASRKAEVEKKAIEAWNNRVTESEIRTKAIDEFAEKLKETINTNYFFAGELKRWTLSVIEEIKEQLKGDPENE